jgi:hypothetical protein
MNPNCQITNLGCGRGRRKGSDKSRIRIVRSPHKRDLFHLREQRGIAGARLVKSVHDLGGGKGAIGIRRRLVFARSAFVSYGPAALLFAQRPPQPKFLPRVTEVVRPFMLCDLRLDQLPFIRFSTS